MTKVELLQKFNEGEHWYLLEVLSIYKNCEDFYTMLKNDGYISINEFLEDNFGYEFTDDNKALVELVEEYFNFFVYQEIYIYTFGMGDGFRWEKGFNYNVIFSLEEDMCYVGTNFEWGDED